MEEKQMQNKHIHIGAVGRKFWAFIISLVAVTVAAAFGLDITTGVATLFATYCIGNVGTKWVNNTGANINGVLQNKD
jgi:hypothetical protein